MSDAEMSEARREEARNMALTLAHRFAVMQRGDTPEARQNAKTDFAVLVREAKPLPLALAFAAIVDGLGLERNNWDGDRWLAWLADEMNTP